jgi:TPR repeat protein
MYNRGRGVERNPPLAEQWIRRALPAVQSLATAGAAWAQADLGSLYEDGLVVAKNDAEAVRWYRLAARQGYAGAQTNLGVMYANGAGVETDLDQAIRWLRSAAAQGDKIAIENLATLGAR